MTHKRRKGPALGSVIRGAFTLSCSASSSTGGMGLDTQHLCKENVFFILFSKKGKKKTYHKLPASWPLLWGGPVFPSVKWGCSQYLNRKAGCELNASHRWCGTWERLLHSQCYIEIQAAAAVIITVTVRSSGCLVVPSLWKSPEWVCKIRLHPLWSCFASLSLFSHLSNGASTASKWSLRVCITSITTRSPSIAILDFCFSKHCPQEVTDRKQQGQDLIHLREGRAGAWQKKKKRKSRDSLEVEVRHHLLPFHFTLLRDEIAKALWDPKSLLAILKGLEPI